MNRRRAITVVALAYGISREQGVLPGWLRPRPIFHSPTLQSIARALSSTSDALGYVIIGFGMVSMTFMAIAGYSGTDRAARLNSNTARESEPPSYSVLRHIAQFLPVAVLTLGTAASMQKKDSGPFFLGILKTFGTVFPFVVLLCGLLFVPYAIMWLIIKKLHIEPYKTIWRFGTTVVPRLMLYSFLCLLLEEGLSLLSRPPVGILSYFIEVHVPLAVMGFKRLGIVSYVGIAAWRATDATAAYFFTRAAMNMRLPPGAIPWPRESFIPASGNRFFVAPFLLPVAMIVNGCVNTMSSVPVGAGLRSAAVVVGSITLAIFAVWVYVLFAYGIFMFLALRRQAKAVKTSQLKTGKIAPERKGWITCILDELARQVFAFGAADALQKWRADSKKRL